VYGKFDALGVALGLISSDSLSIYDGTSSTDPLLGRYNMDNLPGSTTEFVSSSGSLYVEFVTDSLTFGNQEEGFAFAFCSGTSGATQGIKYCGVSK